MRLAARTFVAGALLFLCISVQYCASAPAGCPLQCRTEITRRLLKQLCPEECERGASSSSSKSPDAEQEPLPSWYLGRDWHTRSGPLQDIMEGKPAAAKEPCHDDMKKVDRDRIAWLIDGDGRRGDSGPFDDF